MYYIDSYVTIYCSCSLFTIPSSFTTRSYRFLSRLIICHNTILSFSVAIYFLSRYDVLYWFTCHDLLIAHWTRSMTCHVIIFSFGLSVMIYWFICHDLLIANWTRSMTCHVMINFIDLSVMIYLAYMSQSMILFTVLDPSGVTLWIFVLIQLLRSAVLAGMKLALIWRDSHISS
jgi:hypothetical protein